MPDYLPEIGKEQLQQALLSSNIDDLRELLTEPLHEELYRRGDFKFLDDLTEGQQLLLSYDYVKNQVTQGGFIQLLVNGYLGLLPEMPRLLNSINAADMAQVIDDVLKVYVLNHETFDREIDNQTFVRLHEELKEFELLDKRFAELNDSTVALMMAYTKEHLGEFVKPV